jgi:cytochrome c oxidase subunit 2
MIGTIVVLPPADYAAWVHGVPGGLPSGTPENRGLAVYRRFGCAECHEDPLARRGPPLRGLYGSVVTLADGQRVPADEQYLHDAILLAPKYRLPGYALTMPTFEGIISPSDAMDLIAYLKSLAPNPPKLATLP